MDLTDVLVWAVLVMPMAAVFGIVAVDQVAAYWSYRFKR